MMKRKYQMLIAIAATFVAVPSANAFVIQLQGDILLNGISTTSGQPLTDAAGLLRYGYFSSFTNEQIAANAMNIGALNADFVEVASTTTFFEGFPGFSSQTYTLVETANNPPASNYTPEQNAYIANVAGKNVYLWAFNTNDIGMATEHGVFTSSITFASGADDLNGLTAFTVDSGAPGLQAVIGSAASGPDIGGGAASHQLAVVPEPSQIVLLAAGLGGLLFRRRRA